MTNLRDHIIEWLESIGADGLFDNVYQSSFIPKEDLRGWGAFRAELVPAFRHADGSYHTKPEASHDEHCPCICQAFKDWNKHKEDGR